MITYRHYCLEYNILKIALTTGGELELDMGIEALYLNGDNEIAFNSEISGHVFYKINGELYSAHEVIEWAQNNHESIIAETELEQADEQRMAHELSSPYLTGRV